MATSSVTLKDIADSAGVSKATASLVMRDSPKVADETRERVLQAAIDLGYVYNRAAAAMRSSRTGVVGLVVTTVGNPFFAELAEGMESAFSEFGLTFILTQHSESLTLQRRQIEVMLENRVDGVLIVPAYGTPPDHVERLSQAGVAAVALTRKVDGANMTYVGSDNQAGARSAVAHLIGHGCTDIAFVGGVRGTSSQFERESGCYAAVAVTAGAASVHNYPSPSSPEAGYAITRELMSGPRFPQGILAYNDNVALGVIAAVRDSGKQVGTDVKVIGFDDVAVAKYLRPSLTSVNSRPALIGQLSAETLRRAIANPLISETVLVPNSLSIRESCGCLPD
jgi:LacI family transcriptional regulator